MRTCRIWKLFWSSASTARPLPDSTPPLQQICLTTPFSFYTRYVKQKAKNMELPWYQDNFWPKRSFQGQEIPLVLFFSTDLSTTKFLPSKLKGEKARRINRRLRIKITWQFWLHWCLYSGILLGISLRCQQDKCFWNCTDHSAMFLGKVKNTGPNRWVSSLRLKSPLLCQRNHIFACTEASENCLLHKN